MRRRPVEEGNNLDSLLDALTNVVGILIIMLVVALLGMSEAVKRITQARELDEKVNVDHLLQQEKELEALKEMLKKLEPEWLSMEPKVPQYKVELEKLRAQIEKLSEKVTIESENKKLDVAELESDFKEKSEAQQKLEADLKKAIERLEELKALLDKTPVPQEPPAEIVRIPNPRDVDKSYRKVTFHIDQHRVIEEEVDFYRDKLERNIAAFENRFRPLPETDEDTGGYDFDKFKELIDKTKYGDRNIRIDLKIYTTRIYMDFYITGTSGDDIDSMDKPSSKYMRSIIAMKRNGKQYARYKVSADSFAEYVKARTIADNVGVPAGWEVVINEKKPNWSAYVPVKLQFNKPKPKPKPDSGGGGDKPKPKPQPEKKPERAPLRDTLID
jgi:hypothetical protein